MPSPVFPEPPPSIPDTPHSECDAAVNRVADSAERWAKLEIPERIELLRRCRQRLLEVADDWVETACRLKGHAPGSSGEGEEWLAGPMVTVRNLTLLIEALQKGGQPKPPALTPRSDGQMIARVFPHNGLDRALYAGWEAEVRIARGKPPTQGRIYRKSGPPAKGAALVLGAGNVASIPPMDMLYKLFVENEPVVLKMNPVNAALGPFLERSFKPLIDAGFFAVVYGGAKVGAHLCHHDRVASIHITGSGRTHDAIVWGSTPEEQARRKKAGEPLLHKPITSELGCVTPCLVVPGPWSDEDIAFQARHVASMVANNASFNCNAAKVLVLPKGWQKRDAFLKAVRDALVRIGPRKAYYPGAQSRYQRFLERYPQALALGERSDDVVPWTVIEGVTPRKGEYALTNEAFCGVLAVVDIDAAEADDYLAKAVPFCNDEVWGTLSCMILVHPETQKQYGPAVEAAIDDLRYGGIGVNLWAGVIYALVVTPWGAYPMHTLEDVGSGIGVVHNSFLFDHVEKSVVRAPFRIKPTPPWFADHKNIVALARKLTWFEAAPSWFKLPGVVLAAVKG